MKECLARLVLITLITAVSCSREEKAKQQTGGENRGFAATVGSSLFLGQAFSEWLPLLPDSDFIEHHSRLPDIGTLYHREWVPVDKLVVLDVPVYYLKVTRASEDMDGQVISVQAKLAESDAKIRNELFMELARQLFITESPTTIRSEDYDETRHLSYGGKGSAAKCGSDVWFHLHQESQDVPSNE